MFDDTTSGAASGQTSKPAEPPPYQPKHVPFWNNVITIAGLFLGSMALMLILTFGLFSAFASHTNAYVDIVGFLILPILLIIGLILMPLGILMKSWRMRRHNPELKLAFGFPRVDLNDPTQRKVAKFVVISTFILLPVVGVSSYHGYHYTDSTQFCSQACHAAMEPQGTTHLESGHARVGCAECHIGEGATWFVKSKLSGTRQVWRTLRDTYSRPIAPAIHHLRPSRDTCEQCHWPEKFYGRQLKTVPHFAADESNTRRDVTMLLKIGGSSDSGQMDGIHAHMAFAGRVEYIAADEELQVIPWVKATDRDGNATIYRSDGKAASDPPPDGQLRTFDCMDCHNRSAHKFLSPQSAVNEALAAGRIDATLPFVKRLAVDVLDGEHGDKEEALRHIGTQFSEYYQGKHPDVWQTRRASVDQAVEVVRDLFVKNFFPRMRENWRTYPDNVGHVQSAGCFRCHTEQHISPAGQSLNYRCDVCHTFLRDVTTPDGRTARTEGDFEHPFELNALHAAVACHQCHTGGSLAEPTCAGCHVDELAFLQAATPAFQSFGIKPDPMEGVDCESCHLPDQPFSAAGLDAACLECHEDDDETTYSGLAGKWMKETAALLQHAERNASPSHRDALKLLRESGPAHNIEATRAIISQMTGRLPEKAKGEEEE